jgi:hypothetical protein
MPAVRDGTPGRCTNLDYCSIGMQRVLVTVPIGEKFVCPECGTPLRPPNAGAKRLPWVLPALRIAILVLGIGLGGVQGYLIGRLHPVRTAATDAAGLRINTARAALGLPKLDADALPASGSADATASAPPVPAPAGDAEAAKKLAEAARLPYVQERPFPANLPPLETADPSQHLQEEERFGQVTIDCLQPAATDEPDCHVGNLRGADAFSAASLAWLKTLAVRYGPGTRDGAPARLDHRWRIIIEDFSGFAAKPAAPAEAPKHRALRHRHS